MWIQRLRSSPPASSRTTRVVGSSERRVAITQPAEPAPTTTKSASRSSCWLAMRFPLLELFDPNGGIAPILADIASGAKQSPSHYALEWRLPRRCAPNKKPGSLSASLPSSWPGSYGGLIVKCVVDGERSFSEVTVRCACRRVHHPGRSPGSDRSVRKLVSGGTWLFRTMVPHSRGRWGPGGRDQS